MAQPSRISPMRLIGILALAYVVALGGLIDAAFVGRHLTMAGVGGEVICQTHPDDGGAPAHETNCCLTGCLPQPVGAALAATAAPLVAPGGAGRAIALPAAPQEIASPARLAHRARAPPVSA